MPNVIIKTKDKRVAYKDAIGMLVTPYAFDPTAGWELEDDTYDIFAIVGDTLSITQDEESTDETPHEFSDENLEENTSLGNLNFTADCTDYQADVLKTLYGFEESNGVLLAPSQYKDRYALIQVLFDHTTGQGDIVLPFVKLNARPVFEGMRSGTATGSLTGIAKSREVVTATSTAATTYIDDDVKETPMAIVPDGKFLSVASGTDTMVYVDPKDGSQTSATKSSSSDTDDDDDTNPNP